MGRDKKILADKAISVVQPILENERTLPSGTDNITLGGPAGREFNSRLSAAKAEIGSDKLELAGKFNACVRDSQMAASVDLRFNQNVANKIGHTLTGVRSDAQGELVSQAEDVRNLITAQCAAKVYGGPGGVQ